MSSDRAASDPKLLMTTDPGRSGRRSWFPRRRRAEFAVGVVTVAISVGGILAAVGLVPGVFVPSPISFVLSTTNCGIVQGGPSDSIHELPVGSTVQVHWAVRSPAGWGVVYYEESGTPSSGPSYGEGPTVDLDQSGTNGTASFFSTGGPFTFSIGILFLVPYNATCQPVFVPTTVTYTET
jgi:hypothetical protein